MAVCTNTAIQIFGQTVMIKSTLNVWISCYYHYCILLLPSLLNVSYILDHKPTLGKLRVLESHGGNKVHIIKRLAPHWTVMGDLLEFDDSGTQLSIIEEKHDGAPEPCCRAMFQHWLKGNGVKPGTN